MYPHPENWPHLTVHLTPHVPDQAMSQGERVLNCHPTAQSLPVKMRGFAGEILCNFITTLHMKSCVIL